jgi:hypothetical protein
MGEEGKGNEYRQGRFSLLSAEELMLSVELLSQRLGEEAAIKRLLAPVAAGDGDEGTSDDLVFGNDAFRHYHPPTSARPLTVIYELIEDPTTATTACAPINTIQTAADLPDLICDTEDSESTVTDWDVVPTFCGVDDRAGSGDAAAVAAAVADDDLGETETETEMTAETTVEAAADDAWVVIAGDDS